MQIYLAVAPPSDQEAAKFARNFAHVAYRIGQNSTLLRQSMLLQIRGGLLAVSDQSASLIDDPEALCAAVLRECARRNYTGVLLDFEAPPSQDRLAFAKALGAALLKTRRTLYVPERYARVCENAVSLLCTAISGGSFSDHLREAAAAAGGAGRLALDVQRLRMDFRLPSPKGEGKPLTAEAFSALMDRESPAVFFSPDLCARYFTYTREGETHFVLFDDSDTLLQKLRIGNSLGFSAAFLMWPEVRDIVGKLNLRA